MNRTLTLGSAALLLFAACQRDEEHVGSDPHVQAMSLVDPSPGQQARFERISLASSDTLAKSFKDTLILKVIEVTTSGIEVSESLSEGSISRHDDNVAVAFPNQEFFFRLSPKPAALELKQTGEGRYRSRIFKSHSDQPPVISYALAQSEAIQLAGDRVIAPYLPINRANPIRNSEFVAVLNHEGRDLGLPGLTYVHDRRKGIILALTEFDLAGNASGWRLLQAD